MPHAFEPDAMRDTLQYLIASDIPAEHKRILIEALAQALRNGENEGRRLEAIQNAGSIWQPQETEAIAEFLRDKIARNWQHADELLMQLSGQLHRHPDDVRAKATELGFGIGVDYKLAKARVMPADEE